MTAEALETMIADLLKVKAILEEVDSRCDKTVAIDTIWVKAKMQEALRLIGA